MWILSWSWMSGPAVYSCRDPIGVTGVSPSNLHLKKVYDPRVSSRVSCGGYSGVPGPLLRVIQSSHNRSECCVCIVSRNQTCFY